MDHSRGGGGHAGIAAPGAHGGAGYKRRAVTVGDLKMRPKNYPMLKEMTSHQVLHILRNPWNKSELERQAARLKAAELIERYETELKRLKSPLVEVDIFKKEKKR